MAKKKLIILVVIAVVLVLVLLFLIMRKPEPVSTLFEQDFSADEMPSPLPPELNELDLFEEVESELAPEDQFEDLENIE